jgi:hypothetical protein
MSWNQLTAGSNQFKVWGRANGNVAATDIDAEDLKRRCPFLGFVINSGLERSAIDVKPRIPHMSN